MQDELKAPRISHWDFQQPRVRNEERCQHFPARRSKAWIWEGLCTTLHSKHLWGLEALPFLGLILEFEKFLAFSLSAASQLPCQVISWSKEKFVPLLLSSKLSLAAPSTVTLLGQLCSPWFGCATGQRCFHPDVGWLRTLWGADEARGAPVVHPTGRMCPPFPGDHQGSAPCRGRKD